MVKSQLQEAIIIKWLSLKSTIDFPDEWELLYNPGFNNTEFGIIKNAAGNMRDMATIEQLVVLSNLENIDVMLYSSEMLRPREISQNNL